MSAALPATAYDPDAAMARSMPHGRPPQRRRVAPWADRLFALLTHGAAWLTLLLLAAIIVALVFGAAPAIRHFGLSFLWSSEWDPVQQKFGGLVMIYGTLMTSLIALLVAVPVSFGIALFLTDLSPGWLKRPLGIAVELLAAVPSIVYGMWGLLVFGPVLAIWVQAPLQAAFGGVTSKTSRMVAAMNGITMIARMMPADRIPIPTGGPLTRAPRTGTPPNSACSGFWTQVARIGPNTSRPHMP